MVEISVIIPVYNTEQYLTECVNSVLLQSVDDIEIILVDDESPDNAGKLCDQLAAEYKNIKVIHKKNAGLGMARNSGLEIAEGRFVAFLDSDDYINEDYYKTMIVKADQLSADVCFSLGYHQFGSGASNEIRVDYLKDIVFETNDRCIKEMSRMISRSPQKDDGIFGSACFGIYRLDFLKINNIRFKSEREYISEDVWFNMDCFKVADCICYCDAIGYNYRYNESSLTREYRKNRFEQLVSFSNELIKKCEEFNCVDYYGRVCVYFWINFEKCINQEVRYKVKDAKSNICRMCELEWTNKMMDGLSSKAYPRGFHKLLYRLIMLKRYRIILMLLTIYNIVVH